MPTFTATPEPSNVPPRVRLDFDTGVVGDVFSAIEVRRNGELIRATPPVGSKVSVAYDYEAPFGQAVEYSVSTSIVVVGTIDWTENWASLASWSGDTGLWSVAGGAASSTTENAAITRTSSGTIGKVEVAAPQLVRLEMLSSTNTVLFSVELRDGLVYVTTSSGASQVAGSGAYSVLLSANSGTVNGTGWTVTRSFTGSPTKVRLVSLGPGANLTTSWSTTGTPRGLALDGSGNVYVLEIDSSLVRKYTSAGAAGTPSSWSTTGIPYDLAVDGSGNVYVTDITNNLVRKYNSSGTQTATWSTTNAPRGIAVSGSNVYVADFTGLIRKYTTAGAVGSPATWSVLPTPQAVGVDNSGNVYVSDLLGGQVTKYSSSGVASTVYTPSSQVTGIAFDSSNNMFVTTFTNRIEKFNTSAVKVASWPSPNGFGVGVDASSNVYATNYRDKVVRKYSQVNPTVGQVIARLTPGAAPFSDTELATLAVTAAWLIHPGYPDLSTCIDVGRARDDGLYVMREAGESRTRARKAQVFSPVGRPRDVVITSGDRKVGDWSLVICAPRLQDREAIEAEITDQTPLLLRVPPAYGWDLADGFYSVGDYNDQRTFDKGSKIRHVLTLPLTPVDSPPVTQASQWTFGDVLAEYSTFADVQSSFSTFLDLLVGPQ